MNIFDKKNVQTKELTDWLKQILVKFHEEELPVRVVDEKIINLFEDSSPEFKIQECQMLESHGIGITEGVYLQYFFDLMTHLRVYCILIGGYHLTDIKELIDDKEFQNALKRPLDEIPDWNFIFDILISLPSFIRNFYIVQIECTNEQQRLLSKALDDNDSQAFLNCVMSLGKESWCLKHITDLYSFFGFLFSLRSLDAQSHFSSMDTPITFANVVFDNAPSFIKTTITKHVNFQDEMADLVSVMSKKMPKLESYTKDDPQYREELKKFKFDNLREMYIRAMQIYLSAHEEYLNNRDKYPREVQELIEEYFVDPEQIKLYNILLENGITFSTKKSCATTQNSVLDGISIFNQEKKPANDYFSLKTDIENEGDDKFKQLVNYLATNGYIDNSDEVKMLLTYRLTGRCRPNGELPKIQWRGPYELIYLVRHITYHSKDKYTKMQEFFQYPEKLDDNKSRYADQASQGFKKHMIQLYGKVFQ